MRGSFSIKAVLPTIAPDLDYENLDEVADGAAAQVAYLYAALDPQTTPARKAELRDRLLIYCKQDTWAMVEVAYFLQGLPRPIKKIPLLLYSPFFTSHLRGGRVFRAPDFFFGCFSGRTPKHLPLALALALALDLPSHIRETLIYSRAAY